MSHGRPRFAGFALMGYSHGPRRSRLHAVATLDAAGNTVDAGGAMPHRGAIGWSTRNPLCLLPRLRFKQQLRASLNAGSPVHRLEPEFMRCPARGWEASGRRLPNDLDKLATTTMAFRSREVLDEMWRGFAPWASTCIISSTRTAPAILKSIHLRLCLKSADNFTSSKCRSSRSPTSTADRDVSCRSRCEPRRHRPAHFHCRWVFGDAEDAFYDKNYKSGMGLSKWRSIPSGVLHMRAAFARSPRPPFIPTQRLVVAVLCPAPRGHPLTLHYGDNNRPACSSYRMVV